MEKYCFTFELKNNYILYDENLNKSSKLITFMPIDYPPAISVLHMSQNGSQTICGPFIQLMKQLSIQTNSK